MFWKRIASLEQKVRDSSTAIYDLIYDQRRQAQKLNAIVKHLEDEGYVLQFVPKAQDTYKIVKK